MSMQGEQEAPRRSELVERLRNLDTLQTQGTLAELAYRRAREALEKALEEAGKIRLQALEDARSTRERELALLVDSLKALRQSAELQIQAILASAEIEGSQMRDRGRLEAERHLEDARREAEDVHVEASAIRHAAESRAREVEKLEEDFNALLTRLGERLGVTEKPPEGWFAKLFR